ncbi:MAG TPA: UDP-glucose 4-epimerase GalE [Deltaproteobacteria bacterium]|nr:UDP-glucose 4-epimerase GalE [Deltaproteobacteria bacterium]
MKKILVVGGAGYIGSHMCKRLSKRGYLPIVLDNLSRGHEKAVKWGPFIEGSISDRNILKRVFSEHRIDAVMHYAAYCYVGESVTDPSIYYQNNLADTICLLSVMVEAEVKNFVFSSSCAVYGEPEEIPITENHPRNPVNPYGRTKYMVEQVLNDFRTAYGVESVSLRYFNAAGADPEGELGEDHNPETHLIPLTIQAAMGQRGEIRIFGDDYPTPDGTCIRDFIHVDDLAESHLRALERLLNGKGSGTYNLGNGVGYSVREVIDITRRITGKPIKNRVVNRRAGDPAALVGSSDKAKNELGWEPRFPDLVSIVETAWNWHQKHPKGYDS